MIELLALFFMFFLPGYLILGNRFSDDERFALSFLFSVFVYAAFAFLLHLSKIFISYALIALPIILITFRKKLTFNLSKTALAIFFATLFAGFVVQSFSETLSADGYDHYLYARSFLSQHWASHNFIDNYWIPVTFPQPADYRPPLYNLTLGFIFSIFGDSLASGKLLSVLIVAFVSVILYLNTKDMFDEKTAIYATLSLVTLNSVILHFCFETLVYPLILYSGLCIFHVYRKGIPFWKYSSLTFGLAYLIHSSLIIFMLSLVAFDFFKAKNLSVIYLKNILLRREVVYSSLVFLFVISPWLARNLMFFGDPLYTSSKYTPLLTDWEEHFSLEKPTLSTYLSFITSPRNFISTKLGSILKSTAPTIYSMTFNKWDLFAWADPVALKYTLAGILTYPLLLVCVYVLFKNRGEKIPSVFWLSLFLSLILWGFRCSFAWSSLLTPTILLGTLGIYKIRSRGYVIALILIVSILQLIALIAIQSDKRIDDNFYGWIVENTDTNDILMSRDAVSITYFTNRKTMTTPYADTDDIIEIIRKYDVSYLMVSKNDLIRRDLNFTKLDSAFKLEKKDKDYSIYKTRT